jgi:hypothetical protein
LGGNLNSVWIINQNSYGDKEYDYKLDLGGGGGLVLGYNVTDHFGFQTEIKTSKQGQKYEDHINNSLTREVRLNYIAIPVLVKVIGGSSGVKFYANGGVQFNSLTKATLLGNYEGNPSSNIDAKERFKSSDIGLNFGLGGDISLTEFLYLNVGMSFFYSFRDINSDNPKSTLYNDYAATPVGTAGPQGWQWPDAGGSGTYEASKNATGGFSIGLHYMFLSDNSYR